MSQVFLESWGVLAKDGAAHHILEMLWHPSHLTFELTPTNIASQSTCMSAVKDVIIVLVPPIPRFILKARQSG